MPAVSAQRVMVGLVLGVATFLCVPLARGQTATRTLQVVEFGTGRPVSAAVVFDMSTGVAFLTDTSGALSLVGRAFSSVVVRKLGFLPETVAIATATDSRGSVAIELKRVVELPEQRTVAPLTEQVEQRLTAVGFNDRRQGSGGPKGAIYVTATEIDRWKPKMLSDIGNRLGRDLTRCTTYIDGFYTAPPRPTRGNAMRKGLDAMLETTDLAGLELYRVGEAPARYTARGSQQCSLVLWLK